jgi:outer membrane protein OmpA-like peptidoglycan-associated protein
MRKIIIGLSLLFFTLSGIVLFKALGLPGHDIARYQDSTARKDSGNRQADSQEVLGQLAKEQAANRAMVEKLQATISNLESELSKKDEEKEDNTEREKSPQKTRVLAVLGAGTFRSGQVVINEDLMNTVNNMVHDILAFPDYRVIVEGHTDNIPIRTSAERRFRDNMDLSFFRAKAIANILVEQGVLSERISVIGYGETRPVASNETGDGRAKNRRVEVKLVPEKEF